MISTPSIVCPSPPAVNRAAVKSRDSENAASPLPPWPISLLGVPFDNVTKAEAVLRMSAMIAARKPHYVVTANVDFLVQARHDVELRRILLEADLVLCDGTPLLWASRWLGNALPERAAGSDVVPLLIRAAAEKGHRIFLLGAGPNVAAEAAARLREQHPSLIIAGYYSPPFRTLLEMDFPEIERQLHAARPDIVLVSFGCPKQEKWIAKHFHLLGVPVMIGVGATLDFIAGRIKRAPAFMQRTGTECLYRLAQEPRRLARRYAGDLVHFAPALARQWWNLRRSVRLATTTEFIVSAQATDWRHFRIAGNFNAAALNSERDFFDDALETNQHCRIDLSQVNFLDSTAVAVLVQWRRRLHVRGKRLLLLNPSVEVSSTLKLMRLTGHFASVVQPAETTITDDSLELGEPVVPPYPGGHTLAWQGEITAANAEAVGHSTRHHLTAVGAPPRQTFIINLSRLQFIDSAGVELMSHLRDWARKKEKEMRFLAPPPAVRNVLRLAELDHLLETNHR